MPYIRELAELGHSVCVISERDISPEREKLGWTSPETGKCKVTLAPDSSQIEKIITDSPSASIHLLAGARGKTLGNHATRLLIQHKRRIGIISESPDLRGPAKTLRWLKYTKERLGPGRHFDFILAMGEIGIHWFRACGYPPSKIHEFGYVVEPIPPPPSHTTNLLTPNSYLLTPTFLYAGQLIQRKGLDTFLQAIFRLQGDVQVQIIGSGEQEAQFKGLAHSLGLDAKVKWLGRLPATEVRGYIQNADLFVLPSYHDGWGAVVNEALMAGTPVIASRECGSSTLLRHSFLGDSYPAKDVQALAQLLQRRMDAGPLSAQQRDTVATWARCIHPETMARYFVECMKYIYEDGVKPAVPWKESF